MFPATTATLLSLSLLATTTVSAYHLPFDSLFSHYTHLAATGGEVSEAKVAVAPAVAVEAGSNVEACVDSVKWLDLKEFEPIEGTWFRIAYDTEACRGLTTAFNTIVNIDGGEGTGCDESGVKNGEYYQSLEIVDPEYDDLAESETVTSNIFSVSHAKKTIVTPSSHQLVARGKHHGHQGSKPSGTPQPSSSAHHKKRQTGEQLLLGVFGGSEGSCASGLTACQVFGRSDVFECLDLRTDIENCGVCPNAFLGGNDCTSIENVRDVYCRAGTCQVQSCEGSFVPSGNSTVCILA